MTRFVLPPADGTRSCTSWGSCGTKYNFGLLFPVGAGVCSGRRNVILCVSISFTIHNTPIVGHVAQLRDNSVYPRTIFLFQYQRHVAVQRDLRDANPQ